MVGRSFLACAVAFASVCAPFAAGAAVPLPPLRADDVFQIETVNAPQISPDGRRIVYERQFADAMTDRRYSNLWVVGVDGKGHRPLTTGRRNDTEARFAPDGGRLAFVSEVDGQQQIVVRYMDSGETQVVTRVETADQKKEFIRFQYEVYAKFS